MTQPDTVESPPETGLEVGENLSSLLTLSADYTDQSVEKPDWRTDGFCVDYMKQSLPRLWERYGDRYLLNLARGALSTSAATFVDEVEIVGLGNIRLGSKVISNRLGVGIVLSISAFEPRLAEIDFNGSVQSILLSSKYLAVARNL